MKENFKKISKDDAENIPSNRFRDWYKLVPPGIRRDYVYDIWKRHREGKLGDNAKSGESATEAKYKKWEESILRGAEGRAEMEKRVAIAKKYFNDWIEKATDGEIKKEAVSYAILWGSSFVAPRNSVETDLDIGVILKKGTVISDKFLSDNGIFGLSKTTIDVSEKDYVGKVDFFIHKPTVGGISFILFPHAVIFRDPSFTDNDLKKFVEGHIEIIQEDINSALGKGKKSQEELRAEVEKAIAELTKMFKNK